MSISKIILSRFFALVDRQPNFIHVYVEKSKSETLERSKPENMPS